MSLSAYALNKQSVSRSVPIAVCPVQFALYLKCRCVTELWLGGQSVATAVNTARHAFIEHSSSCPVRVGSSKLLHLLLR